MHNLGDQLGISREGKQRRDKVFGCYILAPKQGFPWVNLRTNNVLVKVMTKLVDSPLAEFFFGVDLTG